MFGFDKLYRRPQSEARPGKPGSLDDRQHSVGMTTQRQEDRGHACLFSEPPSGPASPVRKAPGHGMQTGAANAAAPPVESVDSRMISVMRLALAFSGVLIIYIDPTEPRRLVGLTYASLLVYCAYSAFLYHLALKDHRLLSAKVTHWVDVGFYVYLISLTEGTSSIFFYFFFFAILVASFRWGFKEGFHVTLTSAALFTVVGLVSAPSGTEFELNRTLIRPICLLLLGYMIAYWGGYEAMLKRRLALLKAVHDVANPRFGVDHTIESNLQRLADFYSADSCVLVLANPAAENYTLYRVDSGAGRAPSSERITAETAGPFLALPATVGVVRNLGSGGWWQDRENCFEFNFDTKMRQAGDREQCRYLANLLDAAYFITAPYRQRDNTGGRLYVISSRQRFNQPDLEFLYQFIESLAPVVQNIQLLNELTSKAAERERSKISRDIHDTTIQPYVGLKLGLDALYRKLDPQHPISRDIGELREMVNWTIQDLRRYVVQLKQPGDARGDFFIAAVQEYVAKYKDFYGIDVQVIGDTNHRLNGRLGAEAFQIVREGLSNILRHTKARRAFVRFWRDAGQLRLEIGNEAAPGANGTSFSPRSIVERALALGGAVDVREASDGYTTVCVSIPL